MFVMSDRLYLIGGAGRRHRKEKQASSIANVDVWDIKSAEWKNLTELEIARHGHSIAYLGTQILIIGGVTTVYMRALSNIECYCCERCKFFLFHMLFFFLSIVTTVEKYM